jgi:hypothetical protein
MLVAMAGAGLQPVRPLARFRVGPVTVKTHQFVRIRTNAALLLTPIRQPFEHRLSYQGFLFGVWTAESTDRDRLIV